MEAAEAEVVEAAEAAGVAVVVVVAEEVAEVVVAEEAAAAAGDFAAGYQPVRYSRFRKSFAAATFVTRIFSPS
jgi:hypothetical protein